MKYCTHFFHSAVISALTLLGARTSESSVEYMIENDQQSTILVVFQNGHHTDTLDSNSLPTKSGIFMDLNS
jgi:hypothetical protein